MRRCIRLGVVLLTLIGLGAAPSFATGGSWGSDDSDRPSWQNDDSDSDDYSSKKKSKTKKKTTDHGGPAVPEPTGALVFAAGLLAVNRATRRRR